MTKKDEVFDFLQNRILTHYPAAQMLLEGKMPAPRTAIVYPTYICNQNCLWCEYAADNKNIHTMMSDEQLRKMMTDLYELGVRGVEFCGGGEPTLHPALPALIHEMKAMGLSSGLLTNGTKLQDELAEAIVDCSSYVRIGFDGADEATFERLKRPKSKDAGYETVCQNVSNMVALRNERNTKLLISMKIILTADNFTQVEDCVKLALQLGVDSIQFKAARLCDTELNAEQSASVEEQILAARESHPGMTVVGGTRKMNMTKQCWLTPIQIMIDTMGDAFLCCYYRQRKESHCFGNVFEKSLHDVWYGDRHWEAIRNIKPTECNLLDCRFVNYNRIMNTLLKEHDAQFEFI